MRHGKRAQRFCSMRLATVLMRSYLVRISKRESPISTKTAGFSWLRMCVTRSTGALLGTCGRGLLRSEEHTSELQSQSNLVCRLLLEKKKNHLEHVHNAQYTSRTSSSLQLKMDPYGLHQVCSAMDVKRCSTPNPATPAAAIILIRHAC